MFPSPLPDTRSLYAKEGKPVLFSINEVDRLKILPGDKELLKEVINKQS